MIESYTNQLLNLMKTTKKGSCIFSEMFSTFLKLVSENWANTFKNVIIIIVVIVIVPVAIFVIMFVLNTFRILLFCYKPCFTIIFNFLNTIMFAMKK